MYISFVRPVLEYESKIESEQVEAMRIVTGANKLCGVEKLYDDTGWEKLATRRTNRWCYLHNSSTYVKQPIQGLITGQ